MDWLTRELMTGFQKLLCLGLDRTPATDLIDGTVMTWLETLTTGKSWDEVRDVDRVRRAFVTLAGTRRTWPTPADFMECLPPADTQLRIERQPNIPETREARVRHLAELLGSIGTEGAGT